MKTNIAYKSINIYIISILLMISISTIVVGQEKEFDSEILVYFLPDSLEMDEGITELNDISKLKITSKSLDNTIKKIELKNIKKAFPDFNEADMVKIRKDGKKIKLPNMSRIFRLKLNTKNDVESAINSLSKENGVLFAERNMDAELFGDDDYSKQWHLNNSGQSGGTSGADIDAPEAWNIFTGSSSIKIGVIDSGVDIYHEDLTGKVSGDATTGDYHGTHVAGIAAAKANNTHGGRGVDWNAQIVSKQIFDGSGNYLGDVNTYNKIISAVNAGADILNHSWGGTSYSETVRMAFSYAYKMNRVATVAMGNDYQYGNSTMYPAAFGQGVIAIGSTKDNDVRSPFSQTGTHIDVVAPGGLNTYPNNDQHDIWSTWSNNGYRYIAGTSMATPVVSGIASLLKGYNTNLENDDIENIIRISADDVNSSSYPDWDQYLGTGRVNAKNALDRLRAPYVLEQNSVTGGSIHSSTGTYTTIFYGVSGLATNYYIVNRHEVRKTVSLNSTLLEKSVWGRGVNTDGFSVASPNFGMGWCDVVSSNSTTATLRTYVYYVYTILGQPLGYYPTSPSNVKYEYSVLGISQNLPTTISSDLTLPAATYIASSNVTVNSGVTLTLEPGASIIFQNNSSINVYGTLNVNGTSSNEVVFDFVTKGSGTGIRVYSGGYADINYAEIKNAYYGIRAYSDSDVYVKNSELKSNTYAIYGTYSCNLRITGNSIHNNTYGIQGAFGGVAKLYGNVIENNTSHGVRGDYGAIFQLGLPYNWSGNNTVRNNGDYEIYSYNSNTDIDMYRASVHATSGLELVNSGTVNIYCLQSWFGSNGLQSSGAIQNILPLSSASWDGVLDNDDSSMPKVGNSSDIPNKYRGYEGVLALKGIIKDDKRKGNEISEALRDLYSMLRVDYKENKYGEREAFYNFIDSHISIKKDKDLTQKWDKYKISWKILEKDYKHAIKLSEKLLKHCSSADSLEVMLTLTNLYIMTNEKNNAKLLLSEIESKYGIDNQFITDLKYELENSDYSSENSKSFAIEDENSNNNTVESIDKFSIDVNYPNPFNPSTQISYEIPENSFVNLVVYNSLGQEVAELVNKHQTIGQYSVQFNGANLPSGVYFYRLESGNFTKVNKMLLLK